MIQNKKRRGFTLIELLLVMGLGAISLAMITASIHTLLKLRSVEDRRDEIAKQLFEVATRFRKDAHEAKALPEKVDGLTATGSLILFTQKNGRVVAWKSDPTGVQRGEFTPGNVPVWELRLDLLRDPKATFSQGKGLARMEISDRPRQVYDHQLRQNIEAAVGFETGGKP